MDNVELKASHRASKGNSPARAMRRQGMVPAVLYGPNSKPGMLSIPLAELNMIVKRGALSRSIFNLSIDGESGKRLVMIKELQTHPVSRALLHVDFYEVSMDRKIRVHVPVVATGKPVGVENGGVLQIVQRELEVYCLPTEIPDHITVDVSSLDIGDSVHVEDLPLSGNVEIPHDTNFTVITVSTTRREVEEAAAEGEEAEAGAEGEGEAAGEEASEE